MPFQKKTVAVQTERHGGQVRLRGEDLPIPICLDIEGKGTIRATLPPNQWVDVQPEIYAYLKSKFDLEQEATRDVPDAEANEKDPHPRGAAPLTRTERVPTYTIEFKD
jgi:hypothetical protein